MNTSIQNTLNAPNLNIELNGSAKSKEITLTLQSGDNVLNTLSLGSNSIDNKLSLNTGRTTINNLVDIKQDTTITFELGDGVELNFAGGMDSKINDTTQKGETTLTLANTSSKNTSNTLSGGDINITSLAFDGNTKTQTLNLKNTSASFGVITANNTAGSNLILDASNNAINTVIHKLSGAHLSVKFNGQGVDKGATLSIKDSDTNNKTITLASISAENNSTNNTLDLSDLSAVTITSAVNIQDTQEINFALKSTHLTFEQGIKTTGISTIKVDSGNSTLGAGRDKAISISTLDLLGSHDTKLTLTSNTLISSLISQPQGSHILELDSSAHRVDVTTHSLQGELQLIYKGNNTGALSINGGTHTLLAIGFDPVGGKGMLNLQNTHTTIPTEITPSDANTLDVAMVDSTLFLLGVSNTLSSLSSQQNSTISLIDNPTKRRNTKHTLTIKNYVKGSDASFKLYAQGGSTPQADKIIISDSSHNNIQENTSAVVSIIGDSSIFHITLNDKVMVVDASANPQTQAITIQGGESVIGGEKIQIQLVQGGVQGFGKKGEWYINTIRDLGLDKALQDLATSALAVNYDLYLANFNSLNKRMGELRDNANSQGVWARVFGGNMSNDFGAGSKTNYVTAQAGYDYSFTVGENAKNYVGVAIAYGKSWTKSNSVSSSAVNGLQGVSLSSVDSNMVEVGVYNSYVADSGWYNDTILKFDYIMSEFALDTDPSNLSNTNNFAMVLSDEFGYRYKFGSDSSWYIDPQVEMAFGYFNQSDFNRAVYDRAGNTTNLDASQDSIFTLRTRAGMSLGKKFTTEKGFASIYVGAFYEYDYIDGGNSEATGRAGGTVTQLDKVQSNGRAIVNVGSNIGLTKDARLYIDVEKSFGDEQRTFMQFNFGARYSF